MAANPLTNPSQQLSGKPLAQAAQSLTDAQVNGPMAELARQLAQSNAQGAAAQQKTAGYFNNLGQYATVGSQQQTNIANDLNSQLQGIGNDTQNQLGRLQFDSGVSMALHAPQGENPNMSSPAVQALGAEMAREKGVASQDTGAIRSFGATQGANYRGLAASNLGTYALKGQEAIGGIGRATRLANEPINAKIANLKASKGALYATNLGKLRQQEITNGQNTARLATAAQSLGLKKLALSITQQNNLANQGLKAQGQAITVRGQNLGHLDRQTANQLRALSSTFGGISTVLKTANGAAKNGTGGTALPGTQQHKLYNGIDRITDTVKSLRANGSTPAQIKRFLIGGGSFSNKNGKFSSPGYPSWAVNVAYDMATYGYINSQDAATLAKHGLTISGYYPVR